MYDDVYKNYQTGNTEGAEQNDKSTTDMLIEFSGNQ